MKTFEVLRDEFIDCTRERRMVDYANRISVAKYNALANKSARIVKLIGKHYNDRIGDFLTLLDCDEWDVRVACAVSVIQNLSCTKEQRKAAIELIKKYIVEAADPVDARGFSTNLKKWEYDDVLNDRVLCTMRFFPLNRTFRQGDVDCTVIFTE